MTNLTILVVLAFIAESVLAQSLGSYNINPKHVSVSGISSGGYMAGQLGVAYSGLFIAGFGVFAAGPFDCARDQYVSLYLCSQRFALIKHPRYRIVSQTPCHRSSRRYHT